MCIRDRVIHRYEMGDYQASQWVEGDPNIRRAVDFLVGPEMDVYKRQEQAAEIAQATEFISAKPEGFDSPIAQGGSNVSGGQKQRLSIARAIAKHPQIYLFDRCV